MFKAGVTGYKVYYVGDAVTTEKYQAYNLIKLLPRILFIVMP